MPTFLGSKPHGFMASGTEIPSTFSSSLMMRNTAKNQAAGEVYPWSDTHGLVQEVYQAFGGRRIMWGTDWPVSLGKAEYGQTLSVVRDEFSRFIGAEDMEWVLGKTALTLWSFGQ